MSSWLFSESDGIMTAQRLTVAGTSLSAQQPSFSSHVVSQKWEEMEINKAQHSLVLGKSSIETNDDIKLRETI